MSGADRWRAAAARGILFALLWLVLTEGAPRGWALSAAAVLAATAASLRLVPSGRWRWRPGGVAAFVPFFLWHSARAGVDVARRAMAPALPIRPGFVSYRLRLPAGPAQAFFAGVISLLPGTLSTELRAGRVRVHVLDTAHPAGRSLEQLEERVAAVFGVPLDGPSA